MVLDFIETNILVQTLTFLDKGNKRVITKNQLINEVYALGIYTDRKYWILQKSVRSLFLKLEQLSDDDILKIVEDHRNNNITSSVCYHYSPKRSKQGN